MSEIDKNNSDQILAPNVPPPPAEVKVRTMRSDIDGIAKAGGGLPQFKTVPVEGRGLAMSRVGGPAVDDAANQNGTPGNWAPESKSSFPWWIAAIIIVALGLLIFFGYILFIKK